MWQEAKHPVTQKKLKQKVTLVLHQSGPWARDPVGPWALGLNGRGRTGVAGWAQDASAYMAAYRRAKSRRAAGRLTRC